MADGDPGSIGTISEVPAIRIDEPVRIGRAGSIEIARQAGATVRERGDRWLNDIVNNNAVAVGGSCSRAVGCPSIDRVVAVADGTGVPTCLVIIGAAIVERIQPPSAVHVPLNGKTISPSRVFCISRGYLDGNRFGDWRAAGRAEDVHSGRIID